MPHPSEVAPPVLDAMAGRFAIDKLLGRGGMGEVFLARDLKCHRLVALKLLASEFRANPSRHRALEREGLLAAGLRHPNICQIYDVGEADGRPFIAMEYVEGETLHDLASRGPLAVPAVIDIALQLTSALEEARLRQVVHRDLKSTNVLLTPAGTVKILDFGLAEREATLDGSDSSGRSGDHGPVAGTAEYVSPEQALGRRIDHRSDLFSLGVVLYELLTGRQPFRSTATMDVLWQVVNSAPAPIACGADATTGRLVAFVDRLLQKDRSLRYQTAGEAHADLVTLQKAPGGSPDRRRVPYRLLFQPLVGVAGGLVLTFVGLVPGTVWLCAAGEAAWASASDRRTSVWAGDSGGSHMSAVIEGAPGAQAIWIGNRGRVVYSVSRGSGLNSIWTVRGGTKNPTVVVANGTQPAVSPDGRTVVFRGEGARRGLYRVDIDGTNLRPLLAGEVAHPSVSPDGRTVVFERIEQRPTLWSIPIRGGRPRQLSARSAGSRPLVSPDGRSVAFETDAGVIVCELPDCTTDLLIPIGSPRAWAPDGRSLAYVGPPDGANVWIAPLDGGPRRQVTHFHDRTVTSVSWSPDGRRLAVTREMALSDLTFMARR